MANVDVEDVVMDYSDEVRALDGVDLHIMDGEFLAILGPSGSGKTTLIRVIAGLERPTSGVVRMGGTDVTDTPVHRRNLSMVFQDGALYPHLTAERNMGFPLRVRKRAQDEIDRTVGEVAAALTLTQYLQRMPADLSAGHRHGVATGRAIVGGGKLLLMDEPLAHIDMAMRRRVRRELIERKAAEVATIVYATNDQEEAMALADRVAVLDAGRVRQVATPRQLYERPGNTFVAGFVGSPAMNLALGELSSAGDGVTVAVGSRSVTLGSVVLDAVPRLRSFGDRSVIVGVRPEHLRYGGGRDVVGEQRIGGEVTAVEFLGAERLVYFESGAPGPDGLPGQPFIARLPVAAEVHVGSHVALAVDPERLHFFDPEDGLAITE